MLFEKKPENPYVEELCKVSGLRPSKARKKLEAAEALGISNKKYIRHEGWKLSDEELTELAQKLKEQKEKRDAQIKAVQEATGWERAKARAALKSIKANHISLFQYLLKHGYDLSDEELSELGKGLATAKERRKENYDFYIHTVCQKTGWNKEAALAAMDQAKELGISYLKYVQTACWEKDAEEVSELAEAVAEHKEEITDTKGNYIDKIMKATGWSYGKTELEVLKAKNLCGCSYEDYYVFRFYELSPKEQQAYVTLGMFNRMRIKYNDHTTAAKYFDDKAMFNRTFGDHIHRKWLVNDENLSYDDFLAAIQGLTSVIVKPLSLTQGQGIMKFSCNESEAQNRALYEEFMAMEESILEEYIVQHEAVAAFCPASVNTLRITTLYHDGDCDFLYSVFRMGRGGVVDNFHAGGIAASVDVTTGKVITDAADLSGATYSVHPTSGLAIPGFQIPHWEQILSVCKAACTRVPGVHLIGWDFAITPNGVDLIEGNPGASYVVAQLPNVSIGKGLRSVMVDPYLAR